MKRLDNIIICFFDENKVNEFLMFYDSIKRIYDEFYVVAFTPFTETIKFNEIIDEKSFFHIYVDDKKYKMINKFEKKSSLKHIDSIMAFGRLLISKEMIKNELPSHLWVKMNRIIYFDVDILLEKELDPKYLTGDNNYVFTHTEKNNDEFWESYQKIRKIYHIRRGIKSNWFNHISDMIISSIKYKNYFNSGVIIINNLFVFEELTTRIVERNLSIYKWFSDQDLLNYFNQGELTIIDDSRMNKVVFIARDYSEDTILYHFSGNGEQKKLMRKIYENQITYQQYYETKSNEDLLKIYKGVIK